MMPMQNEKIAHQGWRAVLGVAAMLALAGCAAPVTPSAGAPATASATQADLAGSNWRLVEFRAAQGGAALAPADPAQFALRFGADGHVSAKLDCNQGNGPYVATPRDAAGGMLRIGPVVTTRMMCPPNPVGERLMRDLDAVDSYRLVDGRLQLGVGADAGTYVWERTAP